MQQCCGMCSPCLHTLSASASIQPSLHLVDFFLDNFLFLLFLRVLALTPLQGFAMFLHTRNYSLRRVEYAGKSEQEVLHHWNTRLLHSFGLSREHYKYLVFPRNLLPLPAVVSFSFLLPIVNPLLLAFSTVTYSTTDILRSCTTMPRERRVRGDEKGIIQ